MIRYSCHSENFGLLSGDETFCFISRLGFDCIDVASRSLIPQHCILEHPQSSADSIRDLSQKYSLPLSELFLSDVEVDGIPVSPVHAQMHHKQFYHNFQTICLFARQAGFLSIMGGAGYVDKALGFSESFRRAGLTLQRQVEIASAYGLHFHVEPSRLSLMNRVDAAIEMAEKVQGLKYSLDFLHYQIQGIPQEESIKLLPYAGHMHARQARKGIGKCDFADGEIDYASIVSGLRRLRWNGDIAMEFWCSEKQKAAGLLAVEQNILMRCHLKSLFLSDPHSC